MTHEFRLARPEDEAELRHLAALPVPGDWLELSYRREPNFFAGLSPADQVLLGRYEARIVAASAIRSRRPLYVNGTAQELGYLGGLRIDPRFQGKNLLFHGFRLLADVHQADPVPEYLTTIIEGNALPRQLLVRRSRPTWPTYHEHGTLLTLALETAPGPLPTAIPAPLDFLQNHGPRRQFFPNAPQEATWLSTPGAVAALRDLSASRQTVVHRYHGSLRWARPLYNLWARLQRRPRLPAPGSALRGAYVGYWCSDGHRPSEFRQLVRQLSSLAHSRGFSWLYLGIMADDPHVSEALSFRHRLYKSTLYRVSYQPLEPLDGRGSYLEIADL